MIDKTQREVINRKVLQLFPTLITDHPVGQRAPNVNIIRTVAELLP